MALATILRPWHVISLWLIVVVFLVVVLGAVLATVQLMKASRKPSSAPSQRQAPPVKPSGPAPGWYPDPTDPKLQRYWDGRSWTSGPAPPS